MNVPRPQPRPHDGPTTADPSSHALHTILVGVVLGAQSHATLTDRLLGATTDKVTHRAHTPVVIVPPP